MDSGRIYELTIRTPAAQKCVRRRLRIKRAAIAAAIVGALLAPDAIEAVAPAACANVLVC